MFAGEYWDELEADGSFSVGDSFGMPDGLRVRMLVNPLGDEACASCWPEAGYQAYRQELADALAFWETFDPTSENAAALRAAMAARTWECAVKDGRVAMPDSLRKCLRLKDACVLVGVDDHVEVYEPSHWRSCARACEDVDFSELF